MLFDDETREIAQEIVRCGGLDGRVEIKLEYLDASINRISAWVTGYRNLQSAMLVRPDEAKRRAVGLARRIQILQPYGLSRGTQDHALRRGLGRILPRLRKAGGWRVVPADRRI